jgi:hypothetical protein
LAHEKVSKEKIDLVQLADITGQVPGYLKKFLDAKEKEKGASEQEALQEVARSLRGEVVAKFDEFLGGEKSEKFFESAVSLLRGDKPASNANWDHSFFYSLDGKAHAVCGVALRQLARTLSEKQVDSQVLSSEFIVSITNEKNRWVQAFRAEQVIISAINKYGFTIIKDHQHTTVEAKPFEKVETAGLEDLKTGAYQFEPPDGYQFMDSVIVVIPANKKNNAVQVFPQQTTFDSVSNHKHSRDFFDGTFKEWEAGLGKIIKGKVKFEWHFLWVLTKTEKQKHHKKSSKQSSKHGKLVKEKQCHFREYFFSFGDFESRLDL